MSFINIWSTAKTMVEEIAQDPDWTNVEKITVGEWVAIEEVEGKFWVKRADGAEDDIVGIAGKIRYDKELKLNIITVYSGEGIFATDQLSNLYEIKSGDMCYVACCVGSLTNESAGNDQVVAKCLFAKNKDGYVVFEILDKE